METRDPVPSAFETKISDRDMNNQFLTVPAAIRAATSTRVDKENVMQHCQHDASPKSSPAKPSATSPSPLTVRTPSPSGAFALQPRLSLLSLTTDSPATPAGKQRFMDQMSLRVLTPTRLMDSMSVRGPPACNPTPLTEPKPHRHRGVQNRRRRSRDAPYFQQFVPVDRPPSPTKTTTTSHWSPSTATATGTNAASGEHSSADSVAAEMDTTPTRTALSPLQRSDCINPVAFTLWRGGEEDREWLQEQDRSWNDTTSTVRVESPLPPRMAAPRQVSNNLRDVYGANYYWEISRPIPRRRHEDVCYMNRMK